MVMRIALEIVNRLACSEGSTALSPSTHVVLPNSYSTPFPSSDMIVDSGFDGD
jgi:hypothetical protein